MGEPLQDQRLVKAPRIQKKLAILWKGKIIRPSYSQLKDYEGNLNSMLESIGGDIPTRSEEGFKSMKIAWKKRILYASPYQLLKARGNLYQLEENLNRLSSSKRFPKQICGSKYDSYESLSPL